MFNDKSRLADPGTKSLKDYPFCDVSFRQRVDACWKAFVKEEVVLRQLIDAKAGVEQISDDLHKILSPAFSIS